MLRYLSVLFLCAFLFAQHTENVNNNRININLYETQAKENNLPEPFVKLDSIFKNLYSRASQNLSVDKMVYESSDERLLEYAKLLVLTSSYCDSVEHAFFKKANEPYDEQLKRKMRAQKEDRAFNEVRQPKPGALRAFIKKQIYKRLPWEWEFHLRNKYILVIEVKQAYRKTIGHTNMPYYHARLINDLKGNFPAETDIRLSSNFVTGNMDVGKQYLVFSIGKSNVGEHYLIRGLATKHYGFLPIVNNSILDENNVLRKNINVINLEEFKEEFTTFYNSLKGVKNEN